MRNLRLGVMSALGVMSLGVMSLGVMSLDVMSLGVMSRHRSNGHKNETSCNTHLHGVNFDFSQSCLNDAKMSGNILYTFAIYYMYYHVFTCITIALFLSV